MNSLAAVLASLLLAMLLAIPSSLFAQAEIRLEAVPSVVHPGDAFTIEVHVDLLGAQTIGGGEIGI